MHAHAHAHASHSHSHQHGPASYDRLFVTGITLNVVIVVVQVVFGLLAGSLALIADAGHNLSDVLALLLAWVATALSRRAASVQRTYGWRRTSILAALINAGTINIVTAGIAWEAVHRLLNPEPVQAGTVIWVAAVGAVINTFTALLFIRGGQHDLNLRGAFLHTASDAAVSVGVVLAGIVMLQTGWTSLDPIISIVISVVILYTAWLLIRDAGNLILDAVPHDIDIDAIRSYLLALPQVAEVHDLHVWAMSTTEVALTAHIVTTREPPYDALLAEVCTCLDEVFGIEHATIQLECGDPNFPCLLAPASRI
jgi:cobalt-zinc-cadmium efflux system protein